jgi:RNA polymerase sigma-70 factor (ECF subfamily)
MTDSSLIHATNAVELRQLFLQAASYTDEQLVEAFRCRRSAAYFEILVRRYEQELYAFLRRFLGDASLADDCFQATFITVYHRLDQFESGRRLRPWLYAIATNKAIDLKRQAKRRGALSLDSSRDDANREGQQSLAASIPSRESDPLRAAIDRETNQNVRELLGHLSESTQLLIQLAFYQGMKYSEISEILGVPQGTIKSRVFNAMRKLHDAWRRKYDNSQPSLDELSPRRTPAGKAGVHQPNQAD